MSIDLNFKDKVKSLAELRDLVGPRPREKSVIMCHGTFDLVHPGHIRHLLYAKGHADILVASITADAHITKGRLRPYVPEALRAMNLAALELVDYVIIDPNPTPLATIETLQPDFFAKGYEYGADGIPPRTAEEIKVLESYGGEILFTPGDIVYSSSSIIEHARPDLKTEKLISLMQGEGVSFDDLRDGLAGMRGKRVHVVGDAIVDSLTSTSLIGGGTKTPTLSVRYDHRDDFVGGAGIVAKHLRDAGAEVVFSTILGDDALKEMVLKDLADAGVDCRYVVETARPTTQKNAIVCGGHRLVKIDTLDNRSIGGHTLETLVDAIADVPSDAVVFSDFRHGIFNRDTVPPLIGAIPDDVYRVADSQVASRWGNILEFQNFDLITPNEREARFALGDQDSVVRPLASNLYDQAKCRLLILKLGELGLIACHEPFKRAKYRSFFALDSFAESVVDPVGAGDALLAYATLAMVATNTPVVAAILGGIAAGIACEREGNQPVGAQEVGAHIDAIERRVDYRPPEK